MNDLDVEHHGGQLAEEGADTDMIPSITSDKWSSILSTYNAIGFTIWLLLVSATIVAYSSTTKDSFSKLIEKPHGPMRHAPLVSRGNRREILLFGDSLIGVPNIDFHMGDEIQKALQMEHPNFDISVTVSAISGNGINDLLGRVDRDVISRENGEGLPDAVIVLFDSDAVDEHLEHTGASAEQSRVEYKSNLITLMTKLTSEVPNVALSGPILKGELPRGSNSFDRELDVYENINKQVSSDFSASFIPLRERFFASENSGKLTVDGEHPNLIGGALIKESFLDQISSWKSLWQLEQSKVKEQPAEQVRRKLAAFLYLRATTG